MEKLFSEFKLSNKILKNRVVMPPVVCFEWSNNKGFVSDKHIKHYEEKAAGGVGMIIVEATCVAEDGRIVDSQLGIWSDDHIEGLRKIMEACKKYDVVVILQIHHSGMSTAATIKEKVGGPSADLENGRTYTLSLDEIHELEQKFIMAARRAAEAGFDGVELHGAHGFLLNQFATRVLNKREDEYGGTLEKRLKIGINIISGIREILPKSFILGYRLGSNSPTLDDGIEIAKYLENKGLDYIHASHGGRIGIIPDVPKDFNYNGIAYSGTMIKRNIKIPVIVVNEIRTPERAVFLVENNLADIVAIGKDLLTDPQWVKKAMNNEKINYCIKCEPACKRYQNPGLCPVKPD